MVMRLCEMCDLCDVLDIPPYRKEFLYILVIYYFSTIKNIKSLYSKISGKSRTVAQRFKNRIGKPKNPCDHKSHTVAQVAQRRHR